MPKISDGGQTSDWGGARPPRIISKDGSLTNLFLCCFEHGAVQYVTTAI